jgi:branched-chain amino acid transport system substrate-binding protein
VAEGLYCLTPYPTHLEGLNTKHNKTFRELVNVDEEGKEVGTGTRFVLAYNWAMWEAMYTLKAGIEKSGWQGKEDNPKLIKALEGLTFKESIEFPQGDVRIRPEDHRVITGLYVEQVVKGDLRVAGRIPAEDTVYPALVDFTKEGF